MIRAVRDGEADPVVRQWAVETIRGVTPRDYLSERAAIFYRLCREIRYTLDPAHTEQIAHPRVTLEQRSGDCDDMAVFNQAANEALQAAADLAAQLCAAGCAAEFVIVTLEKPRSADPFTHVFLRAQHPTTGEWLVFDAVAGPWTPEMLRAVRVWRSQPV